jgi:cobalt-zinc-cadmium efflux system outer membrane protein
MTKQICLLIALALSLQINGHSQGITDFLKHVDTYNPGIIAFGKLLEAKKREVRTGITPPDPYVSFGYMPGTTPDIGTKKVWSVTQSFSFPTKYILQNKLGRNTIVLAEHEFDLARLNTMLEAKQLFFDFIYNQKWLGVLNSRKELYNNLKSGWQKMLDSGEATILDYNKILLELSSMTLTINRVETRITILRDKLRYISGNNIEIPPVTGYPPAPEPDFETLIAEKKMIHPAFLMPEAEYQISLQEVRLSKSGSLPEFQAGIESEIVPGQTYTGPVAGLTIPLWANSNKVKTAVFMAEHSAAARDAVLLELTSQVISEYENAISLKKSIGEITGILDSGNSRLFLDKALASGEISLTDYFLYLRTIFDTEDHLYELEYEYNKTLAVLYDHELLK